MGPLFTPPSMEPTTGPWGTLVAPNVQGGTNWPGGSYDPETHLVYVYSKTEADVFGMVPTTDNGRLALRRSAASSTTPCTDADGNGAALAGGPPTARRRRAGQRRARRAAGSITVQGLPLMKPPYGRITAIDLEQAATSPWQIAHGETPDQMRNHPALKGLKIPRTGRQGNLGPLCTKTLVICGEAGFFTNEAGVRGAMLRAYDKATGEEKGAVYMPAPQCGAPMTYMLGGGQYIVVAISGGNYSAELLAFRLPGRA